MRVVFLSKETKSEIKTKNMQKIEWFIDELCNKTFKDGSYRIKVYKRSLKKVDMFLSHEEYMEMFNKWFDYKKLVQNEANK